MSVGTGGSEFAMHFPAEPSERISHELFGTAFGISIGGVVCGTVVVVITVMVDPSGMVSVFSMAITVMFDPTVTPSGTVIISGTVVISGTVMTGVETEMTKACLAFSVINVACGTSSDAFGVMGFFLVGRCSV